MRIAYYPNDVLRQAKKFEIKEIASARTFGIDKLICDNLTFTIGDPSEAGYTPNDLLAKLFEEDYLDLRPFALTTRE